MAPPRPRAIPARSRWDTLWKDALERLDDPSVTELRLLERLILNLMHADSALSEANLEPFMVRVTDRGGQSMVAHPGFAVAARCDAQALQLARELRLTPKEHASNSRSGSQTPEDSFETLDDELSQARKRRKAS